MNYRAIVVGRNKEKCDAILKALEWAGCQVAIAADAGHALAIAVSFHPDVIVADLECSPADGPGFLTELQTLPFRPPVVVIEGSGIPGAISSDRSTIADDFLVHPFSHHHLWRVVCRAIECRRRELENQLCQTDLAEKNRLLLACRAQLEESEKMAVLGRLVAGIAHEINTPLGSICANTDVFALAYGKVQKLLESQLPLEAMTPEGELATTLSILDDAIRNNRLACDFLSRLVRSLRTYARADEAERRKADIHQSIENALALVWHEVKRRVSIVREYSIVQQIECDPNRLVQVIMNLLVNAAQAIEGKGEIRIRTWGENATVNIAISDNGKGIPSELQSRIFDSGFTTKGAGEGTGLGLAICARIVKDHGGIIKLQSTVGQGTTFTLVLPTTHAGERKADD